MLQLPDGYLVRIYHIRVAELSGGATYMNTKGVLDRMGLKPSPKGGFTVADVLNAAGEIVAVGKAFCRPDEAYNKKLGRTIAAGRALKTLRAV